MQVPQKLVGKVFKQAFLAQLTEPSLLQIPKDWVLIPVRGNLSSFTAVTHGKTKFKQKKLILVHKKILNGKMIIQSTLAGLIKTVIY